MVIIWGKGKLTPRLIYKLYLNYAYSSQNL